MKKYWIGYATASIMCTVILLLPFKWWALLIVIGISVGGTKIAMRVKS